MMTTNNYSIIRIPYEFISKPYFYRYWQNYKRILESGKKTMDFNDYQNLARETAVYPKEYRIIYPALGLAGETGEVCEKIKKLFRDDGGQLHGDRRNAIMSEISDCMWYLANLACDLDLNLQDIAKHNIEKLQSRKERGVLKGDGDNR